MKFAYVDDDIEFHRTMLNCGMNPRLKFKYKKYDSFGSPLSVSLLHALSDICWQSEQPDLNLWSFRLRLYRKASQWSSNTARRKNERNTRLPSWWVKSEPLERPLFRKLVVKTKQYALTNSECDTTDPTKFVQRKGFGIPNNGTGVLVQCWTSALFLLFTVASVSTYDWDLLLM